MCGSFNFSSWDGARGRFDLGYGSGDTFKPQPHYNIAPGMEAVVITRDTYNRAQIMRWGLVPSWAKDPAIGYRMINARAETAHQKPAFASLLSSKRCLIPANSFFEWRKVGSEKEPYNIEAIDQPIFTMAGLWDTWRDAEGHLLQTFTILTTEPNELVAQIHDRMPVILRPEAEAAWLDPHNDDVQALVELLKPYPAEWMRIYQICRLVNKPENDRPEVLEPQVPALPVAA